MEWRTIRIFTDRELFDHAGASLVTALTLAATNAAAPLPVQCAMLVVGTFIGSPHADRIFALLRREQLGGNAEPRELRYDQAPANSDTTLAIDLAVARRIFEIVMPPGTPLPDAG